MGPFVQLTVASYSRVSGSGTGARFSGSLDGATTLHEWLQLGIRASFGL